MPDILTRTPDSDREPRRGSQVTLRATSEPSVEQLQQRIRIALSILGHLPNPSHTTERLIAVLRGEEGI